MPTAKLPSGVIDLRSDTVTLPTEAMREAMARAELGDDVYGEDPTVNRLQEAAAAALGMEAALFVPSGTMGNLLAVKCWSEPGDEILLHEDSHIACFEMSGVAWFSGVLPRTVGGARGLLEPDTLRERVQYRPPYYRARTACLSVENSHNAGGGAVYPVERLRSIRALADEFELPVHMDGARLFNAVAALGVEASSIAAFADSVMFCLSKGLSCPVGSLLCGSRAFIERARRVRRVVGGGMRQAGVLAAAGLVALETMTARLVEDHRRARDLAAGLASIPGLRIDPVETNIVCMRPAGGADDCRRAVSRLRERGVLVSQLSPENLRLVTHRHIGEVEVARALDALREALGES